MFSLGLVEGVGLTFPVAHRLTQMQSLLAITSLIVMPWLAKQKRHTARQLNSRSLASDATQTSLCVYLSAVLLVGLVLNALLGW